MNPKEQFIDFFRHYRHDWLNHMQIIKGYVSMGKMDELSRFLDHIIIKTHEESQLSQLGNTELAYYLLTYNWTQNKIQLEVEIETEDTDKIASIGRENHAYLLPWVQQVTQIVEEICVAGEENRLLLLFASTQQHLTLRVDLVGRWKKELAEEKIKKLGELVAKDQGKLTINIHNQDELSFDMITQHQR